MTVQKPYFKHFFNYEGNFDSYFAIPRCRTEPTKTFTELLLEHIFPVLA